MCIRDSRYIEPFDACLFSFLSGMSSGCQVRPPLNVCQPQRVSLPRPDALTAPPYGS